MVTVVHLEVVLDSVIMDGSLRDFLAYVNTVYEYLQCNHKYIGPNTVYEYLQCNHKYIGPIDSLRK
jgi:hypothetical protein